MLSSVLALALSPVLPAQGNAAASEKTLPRQSSEVGLPLAEAHSYKEFTAFGQIWTINQDRHGVMYIGVSGGDLIEYDGVTWRKIRTGSDTVRSIAFDESGKAWVGGNGNFGYIEPDPSGVERFVSILDKVPEQDRQFTDVWQALITPQGIFFRSYEKLFRWDGKTMHSWSRGAYGRFQALSAVRGHIYTAQNGVGLQEIVGDDLRPVRGGEGYKDAAKLFLHPYDDTRMIVSQREGMLTLYDGQKVTPFATQADDYLKSHKLYTSTLLRDGSICITTLDGGAVIVTHDGKLRRMLNVQDGLLDSNALSAFEDREGALWIGTASGVTRIEVNSAASIFSKRAIQDAVRFQGSVYVAMDESGVPVQKVTSDPRTSHPLLVGIPGPTQAFAVRIFHDPAHKADQLLASTSDGVARVTSTAIVPAMPGTFGPTEQCYIISQSRKNPNRVFIGHGDSVGSMRWDGQKWIDEGRLPGIIYQARTLAEDADGTLWVAGANGRVLHITVADTGLRDSKAEPVGKERGLPQGLNGAAWALGSVWIGVDRDQNFYRWDRTAHRFVVDNRAALPMDVPDASASLFEAEDGSTWSSMLSSEGRRIGRVYPQPDGSVHMDEDSYRSLTELKVSPTFADPDGTVWATGEALVRLDPHMRSTVTMDLPTLVRQVNAGTQVVFGGSTVPGSKELRLPPHSSAVRFQFAAASYSDSTDIKYQYLLEGADKDWSAWGKQKEANYSGLGPGNYRLPRAGARRRRQSTGEGSYRIRHPASLVPHHPGLHPLLLLLACPCRCRLALHQHVRAMRRPAAKPEALEEHRRSSRSHRQRAHTGDSYAGCGDYRAERQHRASQRNRQGDHRLARSQHHSLQALRAREPDRGCKHLRCRPLPAGETACIEYSLAIENGKTLRAVYAQHRRQEPVRRLVYRPPPSRF